MADAGLSQLINTPTGQQAEAPAPTPTQQQTPMQVSKQQILQVLSNPNVTGADKQTLSNILSYAERKGEGKKFLGIKYGGASEAQQMGIINSLLNNPNFSSLRSVFDIPSEAIAAQPAATSQLSQIIEKAKPAPGLGWMQGIEQNGPTTVAKGEPTKPGVIEEGKAESAFGPVSRNMGMGPVAEASTRGFQFGGTAEEAAPMMPGTTSTQTRYDEIFNKYRKIPAKQETNKALGVADITNEYQLTPLQ